MLQINMDFYQVKSWKFVSIKKVSIISLISCMLFLYILVGPMAFFFGKYAH